jgi:DNA-binding IclR family transcriptional regulator
MADSGSKPTRVGGGIQSLERAASILDVVADSPFGIGMTEISHRVGLHPSTVFHLVKTLLKLELLLQDEESKKYRVGTRLFALASGASRERTLLDLGTPILQELSELTGESSHLAVRSRSQVLVIARMPGTGMLQMNERIGVTRPIHATAIGKALLAFTPERERDVLIDGLVLAQITAATITDHERLKAEAAQIFAEGVAHDRSEFDPDLRCVAMPVHDFSGACVAAIGLSGPVWRMTAEAIETRVAQLGAAARRLSQKLGYRPEAAPAVSAQSARL